MAAVGSGPKQVTVTFSPAPGYGYYGWPVSTDPACAAFPALLTPNLPLQPVTVVISGSPFGLLAETFREGVV
jgi:hypothetical protein